MEIKDLYGKVFDWAQVQQRLSHHRKRLGLTKPETVAYIKKKYGVKFGELSDEQVIELGLNLAKAVNKKDLI